jgi:hypothetical protein
MGLQQMTEGFGFIGFILMLGCAFWILIRTRRMSAQKKAKDNPHNHFERAVWAWARVASATQGSTGPEGMVRVSMELDIHLPGTPCYTATTTWLVEKEMLGYVAMGKDISLKVDPQNLKYIYPNGSWAKAEE